MPLVFCRLVAPAVQPACLARMSFWHLGTWPKACEPVWFMRLRRWNGRSLSATAIAVVALAILITLPPRMQAAPPALNCSPTYLHFANVVVGQTETLVVVATNHGQSKVTVSEVRATDSNFKVSQGTLPQVLAPGESLGVSVTFAPTAKGRVGGTITFVTSGPEGIITVGLRGIGVTREGVTVSPRSIAFGDVPVGTSSKLPAVLTNTDPWKVTLAGLKTEGKDFSVGGVTFPLILAPGQQVKLDFIFTPQAVGPIAGSSFVVGPTLNIPLTGIGIDKPELAITPATLNFGDVAVGTTEKRTVEVSASGGSVTIFSVSSSSSQFAVLDTPLPLTVSVGKDVALNVAFTPQASGDPTATLSFASDAADSPTRSALIGTGTTAFVSLSWIASTSPEVTGYNIYRKTSSTGSYTRINSKLDPDTNYTDATVTHGTIYYYATTAVNSKGKESEYSSGVKVEVP